MLSFVLLVPHRGANQDAQFIATSFRKKFHLRNSRLNRRMMNHFRHFINEMELQELYLKGRLYTWSNERDTPTLERLDRVFTSEEWTLAFPDHELSALATECSDHAPLLLKSDCTFMHCMRFRFENFWPKCEGYLQVVEEAWNAPLPWSVPDADVLRCLDFKLRNTAKMLKSWSAKKVGAIRLQLAIAKEITLRLDAAQDSRSLAPHELALRWKAKLCSLGLASLQRTLVRQHSRITYLAEVMLIQDSSICKHATGVVRAIFQN